MLAPHLMPAIIRASAAVRARRRRAERRALADEWLLWGAEPREYAPLLAGRAAELTSARNRAQLAGLCRRLVDERRGPRCRAYAVNRPEIGVELPRLLALAARLEQTNRPVSARAMARAERLLRDGAGPLYDSRRAAELGPTLRTILTELEKV